MAPFAVPPTPFSTEQTPQPTGTVIPSSNLPSAEKTNIVLLSFAAFGCIVILATFVYFWIHRRSRKAAYYGSQVDQTIVFRQNVAPTYPKGDGIDLELQSTECIQWCSIARLLNDRASRARYPWSNRSNISEANSKAEDSLNELSGQLQAAMGLNVEAKAKKESSKKESTKPADDHDEAARSADDEAANPTTTKPQVANNVGPSGSSCGN